jgi:hypothetical protein
VFTKAAALVTPLREFLFVSGYHKGAVSMLLKLPGPPGGFPLSIEPTAEVSTVYAA